MEHLLHRIMLIAASAIVATCAPVAAATLTTLASFGGGGVGTDPQGSLIADASGDLYGTTYFGGALDDGTVFRIVAGSNTITTLASFNDVNGRNPAGGLVADANHNLYGTTIAGGPLYGGTVFRIDAGSNAVTTLASFGGPDGSGPFGLIADNRGNLYGTTSAGGTSDDGTVFRVDAGSDTITTLASFTGANGASPAGGLIVDAKGNVYGTTIIGGASSDGTVFRIDAGSTTVTTLASFNFANGAFPSGGLVADASGNLYGTTSYSVASGGGTVFRVNAGSETITTLASFTGANGEYPAAGLIADANGNLYGTTEYGGASSSEGTVFRINAGSDTITTLASFAGANGLNPTTGLISDARGNLYGTTSAGGTSDDGTVFRITDAGFVTTHAMPETSTWAMMILGLGLAGSVLRSRQPSCLHQRQRLLGTQQYPALLKDC